MSSQRPKRRWAWSSATFARVCSTTSRPGHWRRTTRCRASPARPAELLVDSASVFRCRAASASLSIRSSSGRMTLDVRQDCDRRFRGALGRPRRSSRTRPAQGTDERLARRGVGRRSSPIATRIGVDLRVLRHISLGAEVADRLGHFLPEPDDRSRRPWSCPRSGVDRPGRDANALGGRRGLREGRRAGSDLLREPARPARSRTA